MLINCNSILDHISPRVKYELTDDIKIVHEPCKEGTKKILYDDSHYPNIGIYKQEDYSGQNAKDELN